MKNDEPIIESIEINDYLFFEDGRMASATTYTAGERAGQTIVRYHGKEYNATDNEKPADAVEAIIKTIAASIETLTTNDYARLKAALAY